MSAKRSKFMQPTARAEVELLCECFAKPVLFMPWDAMPQEARDEFENNGPIPCEGGGLPGEWCQSCRFGKVSRVES